jgi:hypothetical protein
VLYLQLIILSVGGDVPIDNETILVTDFVNHKIKSAQSFEGAHRNRMYVCVHRGECSLILFYTIFIFLKKELSLSCALPNRAVLASAYD